MRHRLFQVGDRVIAMKQCDGNESIVGLVGTVMNYSGEMVGVMFDDLISFGHNLNGGCENGYGWYVFDDVLQHYTDPEVSIENVSVTYEELMR